MINNIVNEKWEIIVKFKKGLIIIGRFINMLKYVSVLFCRWVGVILVIIVLVVVVVILNLILCKKWRVSNKNKFCVLKYIIVVVKNNESEINNIFFFFKLLSYFFVNGLYKIEEIRNIVVIKLIFLGFFFRLFMI